MAVTQIELVIQGNKAVIQEGKISQCAHLQSRETRMEDFIIFWEIAKLKTSSMKEIVILFSLRENKSKFMKK